MISQWPQKTRGVGADQGSRQSCWGVMIYPILRYSENEWFEMNSAQIGSDSGFWGVLRNYEVKVQNNLEMNSQWFEMAQAYSRDSRNGSKWTKSILEILEVAWNSLDSLGNLPFGIFIFSKWFEMVQADSRDSRNGSLRCSEWSHFYIFWYW